MKQPENAVYPNFQHDFHTGRTCTTVYIDCFNAKIEISHGTTKQSALKAARRRCERFIRGLDRLIEEDK